jgi:hypothetical protein
MQQVTIITPIAPHHKNLFVRCADSVRAQTVQCRHLHAVDEKGKGPAHIRNELLKQVTTPYVVFLDADDYLEPEFIDQCLRHIPPHKYVYTDWFQGEKVMSTPHGQFWDSAWHLVTCLLHTDMVRIVGGFDENLPVMEDTKMFLEFDKYDYCGVQVPYPLVHYTNNGRRSQEGRDSGEYLKVKAQFTRSFRVTCCGDAGKDINRHPVGKRLPGDVLVMALWTGNRNVIGAVTGRPYPRSSVPKRMWMNPKDAQARSDLFRIIPQVKPKATPKKVNRQQAKKARTIQDMLVETGMLFVPELPQLSPVAADTQITPNFAKLNEIAQRIYHGKAKEQSVSHRHTEKRIEPDSSTIKPVAGELVAVCQ